MLKCTQPKLASNIFIFQNFNFIFTAEQPHKQTLTIRRSNSKNSKLTTLTKSSRRTNLIISLASYFVQHIIVHPSQPLLSRTPAIFAATHSTIRDLIVVSNRFQQIQRQFATFRYFILRFLELPNFADFSLLWLPYPDLLNSNHQR